MQGTKIAHVPCSGFRRDGYGVEEERKFLEDRVVAFIGANLVKLPQQIKHGGNLLCLAPGILNERSEVAPLLEQFEAIQRQVQLVTAFSVEIDRPDDGPDSLDRDRARSCLSSHAAPPPGLSLRLKRQGQDGEGQMRHLWQ